MQKPNINTAKSVTPMIYAYTTPEIARHNGWTKIGYTEQDVETRIKQQTHTADVKWNLEWKGNALFDDGFGDRFTDKDFHAYLRKYGIEQESGKNNEWFHVTGQESMKFLGVESGYLFVSQSPRPARGRDLQLTPRSPNVMLKHAPSLCVRKHICTVQYTRSRITGILTKTVFCFR